MKPLAVTLHKKRFPVEKKGEGTPCLLIGLGTLMLRTLSPAFFKNFEAYVTDLYFLAKDGLEDISQVTMETLVEDLKALEETLGLQKYILVAHSAFGILALEFVKRYPENVAAIIMVGTPINSNLEVAAHHNKIFEQEADSKRKEIDSLRRSQVAGEDLSLFSPSERFLREYIYRDAPRYWHIPDYDCSHIWEGLVLDRLIDHLFSNIFPAIDVTQDLQSIRTPIFLAAGLSDYDCCPWLWRSLPHLPQNMTVSIFEKSGHWPHYEEADLFDTRIMEWVVACDLNRN